MTPFKKLTNTVAKNYIKKGMPKAKAIKIGEAVSAKVGRKKYGAKQFAKMSVIGRKKIA